MVLVGLILVAGAALALTVTRGSDQAQVDADVLPAASGTYEAAVYVDCSKVNGVAYFSDNPCETFVLLESRHAGTAGRLRDAEVRRLRIADWRHSSPQLVDYDSVAGGTASLSQSWVSPDGRDCAYIAGVLEGLTAERREIFPREPADIPRGVYDFYQRATRAQPSRSLWVRLRPANPGGRCIG